MTNTEILREIATLPTEARKQIYDFIAFLKTRYPVSPIIGKKNRRIRLPDDPFIGMWQGREDMRDSTEWVRDLRREWEKR